MTNHKPATNELFPGRPDYTGPTSGRFHAVHHEILFEHSDDIGERVKFYHDGGKSAHETPIRLYNLLYLPFVDEEYMIKWQQERETVDAEWRQECDTLNTKWQQERETVDAKWPERETVDAKWPERETVDAKWPERETVDAKWRSERNAVDAKWRPEYDAADAKWRQEREIVDAPILAYIREQIPDSAWNGKELVFPKPPKGLTD